jgi:hypothetical protein
LLGRWRESTTRAGGEAPVRRWRQRQGPDRHGEYAGHNIEYRRSDARAAHRDASRTGPDQGKCASPQAGKGVDAGQAGQHDPRRIGTAPGQGRAHHRAGRRQCPLNDRECGAEPDRRVNEGGRIEVLIPFGPQLAVDLRSYLRLIDI